MSLVHTIILPLIIIYNDIMTAGGVCWHVKLNFAASFPFMCRLIVSWLLQLCRPHSNLLIILNRRFSLGGEGHDWNFWRHVWGDERRRAQTSHLNPKWGRCPPALCYRSVFLPLLFFFYTIRCLLKKTIMNLAQTEETVAARFPWQSARRK